MSRKRNANEWRPLVDLRRKEVLDMIAGMERIRVSITTEQIIVSETTEERIGARANKFAKTLCFPRAELVRMRMAAGMDVGSATNSLLDGAQITFDDYLASKSRPVSIQTVHRGLADVYTLVSLFSGAGILDWPFAQDNRFQIKYAIDYDSAACETYRRNIGMHIVHGDIHKAFTEDGYPLDSMVAEPDVIIGGPSCKPFSNANRHTRLTDHKDSDLVVQYMRIVKALNPKVFAMENVPEILTACGGSYFDAIRVTAAECGYEIQAKVIQDNKVGGFTTRRRAVILGSRIGPVSFINVELCKGSRTVGDALSQVDSSWSNYGDVTLPGPNTKQRMSFVPQGGNYMDIPMMFRTGSKNRHSCTYRRLSWSAPSPTIVNWRKPPLIHPTEDRTLSVAEAKALQGLPGNFCIYGTLGQKQQQVGNSVPVALGLFIKNAVLFLLDRACSKSTANQNDMAFC